ncbi:unnamed protein product [Chironomus riparius]|uniref:Uncharacterized protein n=1 Tax=Chironomus riparius TaxID=315576 RepID=A0A9N9WMX9_9DIPT|nr:unnamed protein product [Chironomus riparius]
MKTGVVSLVIAIIFIIVSQNEVDGGVLPKIAQEVVSIKDKINNFFHKIFGSYENAASTTEIVTETYPTEEPTENDILKDIIYPTYISPELIDEQSILVINEIPIEMTWEMVSTINPELEYELPWKLKNHRFKRV